MKRARVISFGVVPIHESVNGPRVLLVEQYGAQGTHWGFPKGQTELGEQPIQTALREAKEEAGITIAEVVEEAHYTVNYSFTYEDTIVDKTVTYFLGFVAQPGLALRQSEIKDGAWFTFEDALKKLTYMNTKDILENVIEYLDEHPRHA